MKRIIAFYDLLIYLVICVPLAIIALYLFFYMFIFNYSGEWIDKNTHIIILFAFSAIAPPVGITFMRWYRVAYNHVYFTYPLLSKDWEKAANNIDVGWNQMIRISDVKDVEIVKLTKEEKQTKVFYKHWFNKYLKINLNYIDPRFGNAKYVYVASYSKRQIERIIDILCGKEEVNCGENM